MKKTGKRVFTNIGLVEDSSPLTQIRKELLDKLSEDVFQNFESDEEVIKLGIPELDVDGILNNRWDMFTVDRINMLDYFIRNRIILNKDNFKQFEISQIQSNRKVSSKHFKENSFSKESLMEKTLNKTKKIK